MSTLHTVRQWVVVGSLVFVAMMILVFLMVFRGNKTPVSPVQPTRPVPTRLPSLPPVLATPSAEGADIRVLETNPVDGAKNVSVTQDITVTFTGSIQQRDIVIHTSPEIRYRLTDIPFQSNKIVLDIQEPLSAGVLYSVNVTYLPYPYHPRTISFTTTGPTQPDRPDTAPPDTEIIDRTYLQDQPDLYLYNNTPYETAAFRITGAYTTFPNGHYGFDVVLLGDQQQAKQAFLQWLSSLGFNDTHIGQLDIRYQ